MSDRSSSPAPVDASALRVLLAEMRAHARNAFETQGPDVVTAPTVVRWCQRIAAALGEGQ
jgi:hypothetical protein